MGAGGTYGAFFFLLLLFAVGGAADALVVSPTGMPAEGLEGAGFDGDAAAVPVREASSKADAVGGCFVLFCDNDTGCFFSVAAAAAAAEPDSVADEDGGGKKAAP